MTINWLRFTDCFKVLTVVTLIMNKVVKPKRLKEPLACLLLLYHSLINSVGAALIKVFEVFTEYLSYSTNTINLQTQ